MNCFALVPAAGSGARFGAGWPKQYHPVLGKPMMFHTLRALAEVAEIARVFVVLAPDDTHWARCDWQPLSGRVTPLFCGGASRSESVRNSLRALRETIADEDWVLVHDAARCCVRPEQVQRLIAEVADDPVGGLLGLPVADTIKRAVPDEDVMRVAETVSRTGLWQAQTPQMFRYGLLRRALEQCPDVTDEAGAVEKLGLAPRLIAADATNLKVTYASDIELAAAILASRKQ